MSEVAHDEQRVRSDAAAADAERSAVARRQSLLHETCELLEADLDSTVADLSHVADTAESRGFTLVADASRLATDMTAASAEAAANSENVRMVSTAADELAAAGVEIARQAAGSTESARQAIREAQQATETGVVLRDAASRIGEIVKVIGEVASHTNLLALNATIEAARAGEAGRGFAVVAGEVKALARQTATAAEDIARRIGMVQQATGSMVAAIDRVSHAIADIDQRNAGVAAAAEQQQQTLRSIASSVEEVSDGAAQVAKRVQEAAARSTKICQLATGANDAFAVTKARIADLRTTMVVSLRTSAAGDRRGEARLPVHMPAKLTLNATTFGVTILDLSCGGALVMTSGPALPKGERIPIAIEIADVGLVRGEVLAQSRLGTHLRFEDVEDDVRARLKLCIDTIVAKDRRFLTAATDAAAKVSETFGAAVTRGELPLDALFDLDYAAIEGTDPPQFRTRYIDFSDRVLPPIQEPLLALDSRVVFCAAVDRNGYLPTHNRKFSQAQRRGDPAWNAANCRNRRIFNDRAGLAAARTTREFLLQTYERDMGNGQAVIMKEVDVPIMVGGRHWGGLRLAYLAG